MSNPNAPEPMAQGDAILATPAEVAKEATYTDPNLHRRIEDSPALEEGQTAPTDYSVGVFGLDSYRVRKTHYHDENSTESEIP